MGESLLQDVVIGCIATAISGYVYVLCRISQSPIDEHRSLTAGFVLAMALLWGSVAIANMF